MIPKQIHYCWFGRGDKPKLAQKCINSWNKFCSDYEVIEWNEDNFDISNYDFAKYCYANKKWAFLSDFARLVVIAEHGGLYFDTDVEVIKPFDDLMQFDAFFGFEDTNNINTGEGFGAIPNHPTVRAMLQEYLELKPDGNGIYQLMPCPSLNTKALLPLGLKLSGERQIVAGAHILPVEYLNPYDDPTGRMKITDNTYSIHWYSKSWLSKGVVFRSKLTKPIHRLFGKNAFSAFGRKE